MYWHEENESNEQKPQERLVDLLFSIDCPSLPVDHAWALSSAIKSHLAWFTDEEQCGLHLIHGGETGNGWERPDGSDAILNLPRRTKLCLRLPQERVQEANQLSEKELNIAGHKLTVGQSKIRPLAKTQFLYARHVALQNSSDEEQFTRWAVEQLHSGGIQFKKMLCGKQHQINLPTSTLHTRSLMIANLPYEDALTLQEMGLGPGRTLGCGLFVPQKSF